MRVWGLRGHERKDASGLGFRVSEDTSRRGEDANGAGKAGVDCEPETGNLLHSECVWIQTVQTGRRTATQCR